MPEDHPLSLGAALPFAPVQTALRAADVVLAVGTEMSVTDALYSYSHYAIDGRLIRIDIEPAQLARGFRPHLPIVGDAAEALRMLLASAAEGSFDARRAKSGKAAVCRLRREIADAWQPGAGRHMKVLDRVRTVLPADGIVSCGSTQIGYTGCHYYPSLTPDTWLFPVGYGALGSGLPVAIGAKLGAPERAVVAIAGGGGFLYTIKELASAVELGLALPVIIWDSGGYAGPRSSMLICPKAYLSGRTNSLSSITHTQPRPCDRCLALLDPLLRCAALVVVRHDALGRTLQVGDDETDAGVKLARMPLDIADHAALAVPRSGLVAEARMEATDMVGRAADGAG